MSTVYLAEQLPLGRLVALKVVTPPPEEEGESEDFGKRFRLEAETLASLHHPNIVVLHDYGQDEFGRYFLVMEYIDGPRFLDLLTEGPMEPARVIRLVQQVLAALKHAHARGVVHRDLKPSNLLVERDSAGNENVRVVDFGLVKVMEGDQSFTRAGLVLGSPHFMSPEQCRGVDVDHRADIYAVGVLMFRALTGAWPFHGSNPTATMLAHLHDALPGMADVAPNRRLPAGLESVVRRCLGRSPPERWPDVTALSAALEEVAEGRGTEDSASLVLMPYRPRWALPVAAGVGVVALLSVLAFLAWGGPSPAPIAAKAPDAAIAPPVIAPPIAPDEATGEAATEPEAEPSNAPGDANAPAASGTSKNPTSGETKPAPKATKPEPRPDAKPVAAPDAKAEPAPKETPKAPEEKAPDGYMPLPDDMK